MSSCSNYKNSNSLIRPSRYLSAIYDLREKMGHLASTRLPGGQNQMQAQSL